MIGSGLFHETEQVLLYNSLMNPTLKREIHVALHAQTTKFRLMKYLIIFLILYILFLNGGWNSVVRGLLVMLVLSLSIHFFFRWKTKAWIKNWWIYKAKVLK